MSYMGTFTSESMLGVQMGTWIFKSMFGFQNGYMAFQIDLWLFPKGNMIFQVDVGFPKWEHDLPSRCWISQMGRWLSKSMLDVNSHIGFKQWVQTMGSNNGFKHDAMHKPGIILMCWMIHSLSAPPRLPSSPPFLFPVVCPLQPLGNSIAGPLHNTAVEHKSYVFYIWWCRH